MIGPLVWNSTFELWASSGAGFAYITNAWPILMHLYWMSGSGSKSCWWNYYKILQAWLVWMNIHRPITGLIESKWQPQELVILKKKAWNRGLWLSSALVCHVPVVEQWTLGGFQLVEWLFIGSQVICIGFSCPSGIIVVLGWRWIGSQVICMCLSYSALVLDWDLSDN